MRRETGRDFDKAAALQILGALSEALSVALLVPLVQLMNADGAPANMLSAPFGVTASLPLVLGGLVVLIVLRSLALERKEAFNARVTFGFAERMGARLFAALAAARWSVVSTWRTADMSHAVTGDSDRLLHTINLLLSFVQSIAMIAIFGALSLIISPTMTLVAIGMGLALLAATSRGRRAAVNQGRQLAGARQAQFRITDEFFNGLRTAKAFGLEQRHVAAMDEVLREIRERNVGFMDSRARSATIYQVASAVALALFAWLALDVAGLGVASIIALMFLYMRLAPRMMLLQSSLHELRAQLGGVEQMLAMLRDAEAHADEVAVEQGGPPPSLRRAISLSGVSFAYPGAARNAVDAIDATIPAGLVTALVGPTGSGKSTVVDLLVGLLEPDHGEVRIDDVSLYAGNRQAWQRRVAYVPQETFLFNMTVAENLRVAQPGATEADLWQALRTADAARFVRALDGGLHHAIGDRGRGLSGGERQRLAIARALLREPDLLILDEATSALDALSQRRVAQALAQLKGALTVVVVAHRPAMMSFADHVIVIEGGRVAASGSLAAVEAAASRHFREAIDAERLTAYTGA